MMGIKPGLPLAALAIALSGLATPADAQQRARPSEEELRKREQEILDQLQKDEHKFEQERRDTMAGRGKKHPNLPAQDPCALLTSTEVNAELPRAQSGKRDHLNDADGVSRCVWSSANGAPLLKLELRTRTVETGGEVRRPQGYRKVASIGDEAGVWWLPRQPPMLHNDMAFGGVRKGKVDMQLESIELAKQGLEPATRAVEKLMKAASSRL